MAENRPVDHDELAAPDRLGQLRERRELENPGARGDIV